MFNIAFIFYWQSSGFFILFKYFEIKQELETWLPPIHSRPLILNWRIKPHQIKKLSHSGAQTLVIAFLNFFGIDVVRAVGFG